MNKAHRNLTSLYLRKGARKKQLKFCAFLLVKNKLMSTQCQWGLLNSRHYGLTLGCLIYKVKLLPTTLNWITQSQIV
jgi:hypothetical protein